MSGGRNLSAEERRALTVATVVDLAGVQDPREITTDAIAKQMKVTQGALFRHFASKDEIWQAVMEWVADRLLERLDRASGDGRSPANALRAMFMSHVEFIISHPGVPRMMFGELQRAEPTPSKRVARTLVARHGERVARMIEAGKAAGEFAPDTDPQAAAMMFIGTVQGLVIQALLSGDIAQMRLSAPGVLDIFMRGIERQQAPQRQGVNRK